METIEICGRLCHLVGLPRSTGQIYGVLYLSPRPLSLDEIAETLSMSKASASTGTRHLISIHAIRQVWIPGMRKDHFEVQADLREVLRANYSGFFKPKLEKSQRKIDQILAALDADQEAGVIDAEEHKFCRERLEQIGTLQKRLRRVLPVLEKFM